MMKFGLNLRRRPSQQQQQPAGPPLLSLIGFGYHDDEDNVDVQRDISRQAANKKSSKEVAELHQKALKEDPSVFEFDSVQKAVPVAPPRKPRYILGLIDSSRVRALQREIIHDKKLTKERQKEDHLYPDKDKYVTGSYKRKLEEQATWIEQERLRQLRDKMEDDITKKGGAMSVFYGSLSINVAFGAPEKPSKLKKESKNEKSEESHPSKVFSPHARKESHGKTSAAMCKEGSEIVEAKPAPVPRKQEVSRKPESKTEDKAAQSTTDHHKRNQEALAAATERYFARRNAKG